MSHERNTAEERYESVEELFGEDGPTVRQPYGIAYSGRITGALTIQKGGLRKLDVWEAVIVTKHNENVTVHPEGDVRIDGKHVGEFEYAFRLGEDKE